MTSKGIHWCKECNVPLLEEICGSCESNGKYFTIDLKPVFEKERKMFEDFLSIELPEVLFRWQNRIMFEGKTLFRFKTDFKKLKLFPVEPIDKIKERIKGTSSESWKEFLRKTEKCNNKILRKKERASIKFIKETKKQHSEKFKVISFGGGKDSVVVSLLVKKAFQDVPLFFGDTTLEYPETYDFIEKYAKEYNYPVIFAGVNKIKRGFHEIWFELLEENPQDTAQTEITEKHTRMLEKEILAKPEHYLWTHKRWKRKRGDFAEDS